jgi:BirA family biotin operon repressor/biotin-[acetyl-CoA-carboxylase] ligase
VALFLFYQLLQQMEFNRQQFISYFCQFHPHPLSFPIYTFEQIPSTNQTLWELLEAGEIPPIAAIALEQTAGRGQWGRQWQSQRGGLYLSLAVTPQIPARDAPHLTLASAWGIATALRRQGIPSLLKWPNDLILEGRKLGGIKSETRIQQEKITQAVIGVGINWSNPVPEMGINLRSFPEIDYLEKLAALTLEGLLSGYQRYLAEGIAPLLSSYLELLESLGRTVTVNGSTGVVVGVTSQGDLRVRLHSPGAMTEISLPSGTISLGYIH